MPPKRVDTAMHKASRWLGAAGVTGIIIERGWRHSEPLFWISAGMIGLAVVLEFSAVPFPDEEE